MNPSDAFFIDMLNMAHETTARGAEAPIAGLHLTNGGDMTIPIILENSSLTPIPEFSMPTVSG